MKVLSEKKLANVIGADLFGSYRSYSATNQVIEGRFARVTIKDEKIEISMDVGVSDIPFKSDYSDEDGVEVILGVDFLQDAKIKLDFS